MLAAGAATYSKVAKAGWNGLDENLWIVNRKGEIGVTAV